MILLPLMDSITVNVSVNFKNLEVRKNQLSSSIKKEDGSDIIIGKNVIKSTSNMDNPKYLTALIRKNINYNDKDSRTIIVNTKKYENSDFYDSYVIEIPPFSSNEVIDSIYGMLVNSIRLSVPTSSKKEKLSLNAVGFNKIFDDNFENAIISLQNRGLNSLYVREQLINMGYKKQLDILDFLNNLDYNTDEEDAILTEDIENVANFFASTKKESRVLENYKQVATSNLKSYVLLANVNNLVNGKNLEWPILSKEQQKTLRKRLDYTIKAA